MVVCFNGKVIPKRLRIKACCATTLGNAWVLENRRPLNPKWSPIRPPERKQMIRIHAWFETCLNLHLDGPNIDPTSPKRSIEHRLRRVKAMKKPQEKYVGSNLDHLGLDFGPLRAQILILWG